MVDNYYHDKHCLQIKVKDIIKGNISKKEHAGAL